MTHASRGSFSGDALAPTCLPAVPGGRPGVPEDGLIRSLSPGSGVTPHTVAPRCSGPRPAPEPWPPSRRKATMPMLADRVDYVIGIDCHKERHVAAIADGLGSLKASLSVSSDADGYRTLVKWADKNASGRRVWAIEGAGSYGAGLTDWLAEKDEWMVEGDRPKRPKRKSGIKSDEVDALRAAKDALAAQPLAEPRRRGGVESPRGPHNHRPHALPAKPP